MMTPILKISLFLFLIAGLALSSFSLVAASRGVPGSPEFGFGVVLYPEGAYIEEALLRVGELQPDWLSVPIDWAVLQPDPSAAPRTEALDRVMQVAGQHQIAVLFSLTNAPAWAQTAQGPDAGLSAGLVMQLAQRYPGVLSAVELFPGANTQQGWGTTPEPAQYFTLFRAVNDALRSVQSPVLLVAAGLRPVSIPAPAGDMDDLLFLQGLYQQGAATQMPVVSIAYSEISGSPLAMPSSSEQRVLRHYEEVRRMMSANGHSAGLVWITQSSVPSGTINAQDSAYQDLNAQSAWVTQSYAQLRSQLYLGAGFLQSLNPKGEGAASSMPSLIRGPGSQHPLYSGLREMIAINRNANLVVKLGKAKDGSLGKKRP